MARPKIKKTYTKQELLDITPEQLNKMSRQELRYVVSSLNRQISAQVVRLEKSDVYSPTLEKIKKEGKPTTLTETGELKTLNQLRSEYAKGLAQMTGKTYTVKGAKTSESASNKALQEAFKEIGIKYTLTKDERSDLWKAYNKFVELNPVQATDYTSEQLQREIFKLYSEDLSRDHEDVAFEFQDILIKAKLDDISLSEAKERLRNDGKSFSGGSNS